MPSIRTVLSDMGSVPNHRGRSRGYVLGSGNVASGPIERPLFTMEYQQEKRAEYRQSLPLLVHRNPNRDIKAVSEATRSETRGQNGDGSQTVRPGGDEMTGKGLNGSFSIRAPGGSPYPGRPVTPTGADCTLVSSLSS